MLSILLFLGGIGVQELFLLSCVVFVPMALALAALIFLVKSNADSNTKVLWVLIILFFPFLGPILYLTVGRRKKPYNPSES